MKLFLTAMLIASPAFAHEFKTKDFCSTTTKDMCAHIGHDKKPDNKEAFVFTLDIINKVKAKEVTDVVINVVSTDGSGKKGESIPTTWTIRPDGHHWDAKASAVAKNQIVGVRTNYKYKGIAEEIYVELKY